MRRLLSTAVQIKAAPTESQRLAAILAGQSATAHIPTEAEMRDALARLVRDLDQMVLARTDGGTTGWAVVDGSFDPQVNVTHEGEVVLRGGIIIERPD